MRMQPAARMVAPSLPALQLHCRWTARDGDRPLTRRIIQATGPGPRTPTATDGGVILPPHAEAGRLDVTEQMARLCRDVTTRCPELYHVNVDRILFGVTQARHPRRHGLQAKITPLRFKGGELYKRRSGQAYQVQRYWHNGIEMLYVMTFCMPRFLDQTFDEKFVTIFHELYHVAPEFNGDLRRHAGRYDVHSRSKKSYDRKMAALAREYLAGGADPQLHQFLRFNFRQLQSLYGKIVGEFVPSPKIIPIDVG